MEVSQRYQDTDFWLDIENVVIGPEIGKGQFSTVYVGKYFGDLVAVKKQIRTEGLVESYILRELSVLKVATHKNLVQYIGACNHENIDGKGMGASYIVTELCVGGDLLRLLLNKELELNWRTRIKIAMQVSDAIRFLHKKHIIHRDLKSSNVLLDEEWNCKISDFGMARFVDADCTTPPRQSLTSSANTADGERGIPGRVTSSSNLLTCNRRMTICGTEEYMAPEMLFDEEYSFGVDIFCFGMMVFEILQRGQIGKDGFLTRKPKEKFMINHEAVKALLPADMPESMYSLATQCTDFDPAMRPDSEQTLDWMQDIYEHVQEEAPAVTPVYTRSQSIRMALSVLASRENGAESVKQPAEQAAGVAAGKSTISMSNAMFSPQAVPPAAGKVSFTSPSGVFKSLFHAAASSSTTTSTNGAQESSLPAQALSPVVTQLTAAEQELYKNFILREDEYKLPLAGSDSSEYNDEGDTVLKEGNLFKINETGFRNWKQVLCTLSDSKLSWVTTSDTSKKIVFALKDTTIRRTRDKRFLLSQRVLVPPSHKSVKAKSSENKDNESGAARYRSGTPDSTILAQMVQGAPGSSSGAPAAGPTGLSSSAAAGQQGAVTQVSGSYGNASSIVAPQYSLLQKELAAQSVEEMESWIGAIQEAIGAAVEAQRSSDTPDPAASLQAEGRTPPQASLEDCVSVEQWLYTTGIPAEYCEQYRAALEAKGYDSLDLIAKVGLQESDLDYLEVTVPAHRRVLAACAKGHYSAKLRLCVTSATKADSSGFVVKVISRWHYYRSVLQVPMTLLRKFDKILRKIVQSDAHSQHSMPALPSEPAQRDVQSSRVVRYKVELYLLQLAAVLNESPHLVQLLRFLELS